jgi:hypothetical protein
MLHRTLSLLAAVAFVQVAFAEPLPNSIKSSPCKSPPVIDGVIGVDEWKDARPIAFDLGLIGINPAAKSSRSCELRVMNSANALYVALKVPAETVHRSINPIDIDFAMLAFCKGKQLQTGDDRKVIGPGIYADKHFVAPNKDADDTHKDGLGAVGHEKGVYSFEWALPLDSGDDQDLRAKPGDSVKFNIAYFDGFRAELKGTLAGGVHGAEMNKADDWGTLELAAKVENDGGATFKGPPWVEALFKTFTKSPTNRLKFTSAALVPDLLRPAAKALVSFNYRDPEGKEKEGKATIYVPLPIRDNPKAKVPLYFSAGYEIDDNAALTHLRQGFAVVTPRALEANPLIRGANPDIALMHIVRSLPFVDDEHVVIGGGSAGGYMTLMLAAETFPVAGAAPDVPPVNWGYNAAYFFKQRDRIAPTKGEAVSRVPVPNGVGVMLQPATKVYGDDFGDGTWFVHSPVAHVATITCPVSAYWTTADVLVPMDQVGAKWVKPFDKTKFPAGFTMDPMALVESIEGRTRLTDVLKESEYEVFVVQSPKANPKPREVPLSKTKQWSIMIIDEGPPEPQVGHLKYGGAWTRNEFFDRARKNKIAADQLTEAKLMRLMDRYAGKEWLPSKLKHLDDLKSERADVVRGLRTYCKFPENAKRFAELYDKLPSERRVLDASIVKELNGGK